MTDITETAPVITDFAALSQPKGEIAKRLAAEATAHATREGRAGGIKGLSVGRSDTFRINPYLLKVKDGWNCRNLNDPENLAHIDMLARSISEVGVKEPLTIVVEDDAAYVTDGHCRLMATFRAIEVYGAEIVSIPAKTEDRHANEADRVFSMLVRNTGKQPKPLEQAVVVKRLLAFGWTEERIAKGMGRSVKYIEGILRLDAAPDEVRELVNTGAVAATEALVQVRKLGGAEAAKTLKAAADRAKERGKTRATKKDIEGTPVAETKRKLARLIENATVRTRGDMVSISLTTAQYATLRRLAGL